MISVYIVDDHQLVIEGITSLLQKETGIKVIGHSISAADCLHYLTAHTTDVVLMDIGLPDVNGIDLCKLVKTKYPGIQVLALSTHNQASYITNMMDNGASGYLLKNAGKQEILEAIQTVIKGNTYFSFEAGRMYKAAQEKQKEVPGLTKREREILKLIATGCTNTAISQQLFISIDTVDTHRKNLYSKLGVKNTALLIKYATEHNLL
jgi:DNA-binding NarL/FixJ family response regulator